jgi:tetratricopeptide (TPR) repeat protein
MRQKLAEEHPQAAEYQDDIAWTEFNLGNLYVRMGRNEQGEQAYHRCISLWEHLVETHPLVVTYPHILAAAYNNLGNLFAGTGRLGQALRLHRKAVAIQRRLVATHPQVPLYQEELAKGINSLGAFAAETGHFKQARAAYDDSIAIRRGLIESHPQVMQYAANQADTYSSRGDLEVAAGRPQAAVEWYDRAGGLLGEVLRQEPNLVDGSDYLVAIHRGRARAWSDLNRPDDADRELRLAEQADHEHVDKSVLALRCLLHARSGQRARAEAEAALLARDQSLPGPLLFDLARVHALLASGPGAAGDEWQRQAVAAIELLGRARILGLFQGDVSVSRLTHDPDFDRLRGQTEFRALIQDLGFPQDPFTE